MTIVLTIRNHRTAVFPSVKSLIFFPFKLAALNECIHDKLMGQVLYMRQHFVSFPVIFCYHPPFFFCLAQSSDVVIFLCLYYRKLIHTECTQLHTYTRTHTYSTSSRDEIFPNGNLDVAGVCMCLLTSEQKLATCAVRVQLCSIYKYKDGKQKHIHKIVCA